VADELAEVRQCQDPTSAAFNAVAVAVSDRPGFRWGVFHPRNGGH
jgi:hypothetical protein